MYNTLEAVGYLMAAAGLWAVIYLALPQNWPYFHKGCLPISLGIGVLLVWQVFGCSYHWSPNLIVSGFPFAAAFFEVQKDGSLRDFVGPMTLAHYLLNLFLGLSLPHVFLAAYVWRKKRRDSIGARAEC